VTGVRARDRSRASLNEIEIAADLVLDASGRGSKAPQWLDGLGYTPPQETVVNAFPGYVTRIYRRPNGYRGGWKTLNIIPTPPDSPRGGVIIPLEGGRWQVALVGLGRDYPPTDEEGFLAFARSLPSPRLYEAIKNAEPLTPPYGYRRNENRLRHYERLPGYLEGFVALGDAVYTLNPVHAQGITAAAMGAQVLDDGLKAQRRQRAAGDLTSLAESFQKRLHEALDEVWRSITRSDQRWLSTEVAHSGVMGRPRAVAGGGRQAPAAAG